jgi:hypothetical protein
MVKSCDISADLLRKYLTKYQVWGEDNNKLADFRDAQQYYSQAIRAFGDYYKARPEEKDIRMTILFTGTAVAMRAVNSFEHVIARYNEEFRADKSNIGKLFVIPGTDDPEVAEKLESYQTLSRNFRDLTPDLDLWLKKFSLHHKNDSVPESDDCEDVSITENGLRINHLKYLIDYCEIMIRSIYILATDDPSETEKAEKVNYHFQKGSDSLIDLLLLYSSQNLADTDPKDLSEDQFKEYCVSCTNMFRNLMSALLLSEDIDLDADNMSPSDLAATLLAGKRCASANMIDEFENNLHKIFAVEETGDPKNFGTTGKLIVILSRALEIAQEMKTDITMAVAKVI